MAASHVDLTWEAVVAICAALGLMCGGLALYVQYAIRSALGELYDKLNGRYVRSELCMERHVDHMRRLDRLERIDAKAE